MVRKKITHGYYDAAERPSDVPPAFEEAVGQAANDAGVYGQMPDDGREIIRYCPWCGRELDRDNALSGSCPHCFKGFSGDVAIEITKEAVLRFLEQFRLTAAMDAVAMYKAALSKKNWRNMSVTIKAARDILKEWGLFPDKQELVVTVDTVDMVDADAGAKAHIKARQGIGLLPSDEPNSQIDWWIIDWYEGHGYGITITSDNEPGETTEALPAPELHGEPSA